ncbi:MAG: hypothetical protein AAFY88_07370, partial [Acidobacteriota bacterium]
LFGKRARAAVGAFLLFLLVLSKQRFGGLGSASWSVTRGGTGSISVVEMTFFLLLICGCLAVALGHRAFTWQNVRFAADRLAGKRPDRGDAP